MRLDKSLKAAALAALAGLALGVHALPPAAPGGPAVVGAPAPAVLKTPTAEAVQAVPIGKPTDAQGDKRTAGTLRELEELQRQTALAEMRKRLNELKSGGPGGPGVAAPFAPSIAENPAPNMRPVRVKTAPPPAINPGFPPPPNYFVPRAKLVSLMVVAGRARADIVQDRRVTTIKEGDSLDAWNVARITAEGVFLEQRGMRVGPPPGLQPPASAFKVRSSSAAAAMPGAYAYVNSQRATPAVEEDVRTFKLESAMESDLPQRAVATTADAPAPAQPPQTAPAMVPPLPGALRPDSATSAVAPPLPPYGGVRGQVIQ